MDEEKGNYAIGESGSGEYNTQAPYVDNTTHHLGGKQGNLNEAVDIYGSAAEAEKYGYVSRGYVYRIVIALRSEKQC
jgi:hypothetical protein